MFIDRKGRKKKCHALNKFVLIPSTTVPLLTLRGLEPNLSPIAYLRAPDIGGLGLDVANDWLGQYLSLTTLPAPVPRYATLHMGTCHDRNFCSHVLMNSSWSWESQLICIVIPGFLFSGSTSIGNLFPWIPPEVKYQACGKHAARFARIMHPKL